MHFYSKANKWHCELFNVPLDVVESGDDAKRCKECLDMEYDAHPEYHS